ncbi:uncharacterized protein K02A2.6-like [Wyeomyia smithii]|uniref:uncharacterized protein K02A2.6-like n=1 Tax=Wyeomyia smithii TaxID=174621 RepID=UPI002467B557|nr:uncharacterized protein K02A2.6-like [Wyeomyia smithii]
MLNANREEAAGDENPANAAVATAPVAMQSSFTIDPFDRHRMTWSRWVERLEGAFVLFGVHQETKLYMLLHFMGGETYDVVCDKLAPEKPQRKTYAEIVRVLEAHFNPEPLEILENFRFKSRKQGEDRPEETIDEYLIALRKLAITCNFGEYLNTALRNQLVFGLKDRTIQSRLLEVQNLTLERAREIAVSMELSSKGGREIQSRQGKPEINLVEQKKFNAAKSCNSNDIVTLEEICKLEETSRTTVSKFHLDMKVNNVTVRFEVDTGAPVTIISTEDKKKIFPEANLLPSDLELVSYCNSRINVKGMKIDLNDVAFVCVHTLDSTSANTLTKITPVNIRLLVEKYANIYDKSIGKIEGLQAKLSLKPNARPVYIEARQVPFSLRDAVEKELDILVQNGVLEKVNHSRWATPIVPILKSNNRVRLCGDYKVTVNPNLEIDDHPVPTIEELFANVAGGEKFTKIDLTQAYLQLEVEEGDREVLTLSTHKGLYRPTRLMYGIASAPAIWQRLMEQVLNGIPGVTVFLDDIRVTGPNDLIHLQRLEDVLKRLSSYNMRINLEKCQFFENAIEYCGYLIDKVGIHKVPGKIDAVQNMPIPKNKDQVRSFVGLVNYYGRFFPNLSTTLYPLNNLLKNTVPFVWSKECDEAFNKIKCEMQSEKILAHYDSTLPLVLATDASPYGVGAVLSHVFSDGSERPIQYASQTLNATQQAYKQIDREAYAIIFGVRKFYQYLYGKKFTLVTDNEPLKQIFSDTKGLPKMSALIMQHYATFLQSFNFKIQFRPTNQHANADAFSRLPLKNSTPDATVEETDYVEVNIIETLPLTVAELAKATAMDTTVKTLVQGLQNGKSVEPKDRFGVDQVEFTLQKGCVMRGIRVYVPPSLRDKVLNELHSTHFGITRLKTLARGYVWWERIDKNIEDVVRNCSLCQSTRAEPSKVPTHCWETPAKPFERVHVDFAGPFMNVYFIVFVDAYTKWPEVRILNNITTNTTIQHNQCDCKDKKESLEYFGERKHHHNPTDTMRRHPIRTLLSFMSPTAAQ